MIKTCTLCGGKVSYVNHTAVYGKEHSSWPFIYLCDECGAYVGVHEGTNIPLGTLANEATRQARRAAHDAFDTLWENGDDMGRNEAYRWLAQQMQLEPDDCHIAMFSIEQCSQVVKLVMSRRK